MVTASYVAKVSLESFADAHKYRLLRCNSQHWSVANVIKSRQESGSWIRRKLLSIHLEFIALQLEMPSRANDLAAK